MKATTNSDTSHQNGATKEFTDSACQVSNWSSVRVLAAIDYMPYTIIRAGESGKIIATDAPEGVEVFLDEHHPKLAQWDNCILLLPEETIKLVGSSE